jgi:hypothetical protein
MRRSMRRWRGGPLRLRGCAQRAAVGRAAAARQPRRLYLSTRPLWLLDEPFTAIDVQGVARSAALSRARAAGGAVLLTSHQSLDVDAPCASSTCCRCRPRERGQAGRRSTGRCCGGSSPWPCGARSAAQPAAVLRHGDRAVPPRARTVPDTLSQFAGGILWIVALLANMLGANRCFAATSRTAPSISCCWHRSRCIFPCCPTCWCTGCSTRCAAGAVVAAVRADARPAPRGRADADAVAAPRQPGS